MTTASPSAPFAAAQVATTEDGGLMHFLRFLVIGFAMGALTFVLFVGLIWRITSLSKVGYRKRDILLFLIPIVNIIVGVRTLWRYTAKNVYWSVRDDRPSSSLFSGS